MDLNSKHDATVAEVVKAISERDPVTLAAILDDGSVVLFERFWTACRAVVEIQGDFALDQVASELVMGDVEELQKVAEIWRRLLWDNAAVDVVQQMSMLNSGFDVLPTLLLLRSMSSFALIESLCGEVASLIDQDAGV